MIFTVFRVYRKALVLRADIYHLHDPELLPIGLLLKLKGKSVVYDSHEDYPADILSKYWIPAPARKFVSYVFNLLEKNTIRFYDGVITVHEQIAPKFYPYQKNTVVVHNFPVLNSSLPLSPITKDNFVWLGILSPIRGSKQIEKALSMVNDASIDVLGPQFSGIMHDRVNYVGSFPQQEALHLASTYLAGLVTYLPEPNHIDALPNKLFEYMSIGIPVIASNFPKWKAIVDDAQCGLLVDPLSPKDLATAMKWMLDNREEAKRMGARGKQAVLDKYNWKSEERILFSTYDRISIKHVLKSKGK